MCRNILIRISLYDVNKRNYIKNIWFPSLLLLQNKQCFSIMIQCLIKAYCKNIIKLGTHKCFGNPASYVQFIVD